MDSSSPLSSKYKATDSSDSKQQPLEIVKFVLKIKSAAVLEPGNLKCNPDHDDSSKFIQLLVYLIIGLQCVEFSLMNSAIRCLDSEHEALLKFGEGFSSGTDYFSSWKAEEDC
ncbi:hypothetical protein CFP56_037787 [Quercus suber]|uniref:Uncharacterized protein n=1 Tax=Quercus suber TaxID=58331 RepID=A0AAW0J529_QUESU